MNEHFLNIGICHICSVPYSNMENSLQNELHIEAKSIENWSRYQLRYEFMSFPNTHWHACQVFWLISQPIINGCCFKIAYFEGMNMTKSIFEYWIFVLTGNIFIFQIFRIFIGIGSFSRQQNNWIKINKSLLPTWRSTLYVYRCLYISLYELHRIFG